MISANSLTIILTIVLGLAAYESLNYLLSILINRAYQHISDSGEELLRDGRITRDKFIRSADIISDMKKELATLKIIKVKKEKIGYIMKLIAHVEAIIFFSLGFCLIRRGHILSMSSASILLALIAGWMAIKIVGNYSQWSGAIFGRATYYLFLLGSFANIGMSFGFGLTVGALFKNS